MSGTGPGGTGPTLLAIFEKESDVFEDPFFNRYPNLCHNVEFHVTHLGKPYRIIYLNIENPVIDSYWLRMIGKTYSGYFFPEVEYFVCINIVGRKIAVLENSLQNSLEGVETHSILLSLGKLG